MTTARRGRRTGVVALGFLLALVLAVPAGAGDEAPSVEVPETIRVAVRELPPFVEREGEGYTGFTIDLWEEVAGRLGVETEYVEVEAVTDQLAAVEGGDADMAATAISITEERETNLDFSHSYFDSGLQIMVPANQSVSLGAAFAALADPAIFSLLAILAMGIVLVGILVWLLERRHNPDFRDDRALRGAEEGLWWAIVTVATVGYGDRVATRPVSRIIAVFWMLFGIIFIAQFTATITANLTLSQLDTDISTPADLAGASVATVEGTTAAEYLASRDIDARMVADVDEMVALVADDDVDAVVHDAPILLYQADLVGSDRVALVGTTFTYEGYGVALAEGSPLLEPINQALLELLESGEYGRLRRAWFPADDE